MSGEFLPKIDMETQDIQNQAETYKNETEAELAPLYEVEAGEYVYKPLGRMSDLGLDALGSIGEKAEPLNKEKAQQIEEAASPMSRVICCIDGRRRFVADKIDGTKKRAFRIVKKASGSPLKFAGGAAGLAYSSFLSGLTHGIDEDNYAKKSKTETIKNVLRPLKLKGSVHSDDHAHGHNCGCGACDKLSSTNDDIRKNIDSYHDIYDALTMQSTNVFPISEDADRSSVLFHSTLASDKKVLPSGKDITREYKANTDEPELDHDEAQVVVKDDHREEFIVIDLDGSGTVDKNKLPFQIFWVDLGAFSKEVQKAFTAEDGPQSKRNANRLIYSSTIFQIATAKQLVHGDMPVYIRQRK